MSLILHLFICLSLPHIWYFYCFLSLINSSLYSAFHELYENSSRYNSMYKKGKPFPNIHYMNHNKRLFSYISQVILSSTKCILLIFYSLLSVFLSFHSSVCLQTPYNTSLDGFVKCTSLCLSDDIGHPLPTSRDH